jgi:hypothetical protein
MNLALSSRLVVDQVEGVDEEFDVMGKTCDWWGSHCPMECTFEFSFVDGGWWSECGCDDRFGVVGGLVQVESGRVGCC